MFISDSIRTETLSQPHSKSAEASLIKIRTKVVDWQYAWKKEKNNTANFNRQYLVEKKIFFICFSLFLI
jgi:hypothetical protein